MFSRIFGGKSGYVKEVVNPYGVHGAFPAGNRKGITVKGEWSDEILAFIKKKNIKAVYLNVSNGWKGGDYNFLSSLETIEELDIIDGKTPHLSGLECMTSLRDLSISSHTSGDVDFSKLKNLQYCFLSWWPGANSIFDTTSLEGLYLDTVKLKDFSLIGNLRNLKCLIIGNSPIATLEWLPKLEKLEKFELLNARKLNNFQPISLCSNLKRLTWTSQTLVDI